MKRILIALAMLAAVQVADAQVKSPDAAAKAVAKAELASADAKKATKVATWITLAKAYMDAYDAPAGNALTGISKLNLAQYMGSEKPLSEETVVVGGVPYIKSVYANKDLYFNEAGILQIIYITKPVVENPLAKAYEAYKEAYKVDVKASKEKDITAGLASIKDRAMNDAFTCYTLGEYAKASDLFAFAGEVSATAPLNNVDSEPIYNAGYTAMMVEDFEKAKVCFEKCLENGYYYENGEVFARLATIYDSLGEKAKSVEVLEAGFAKFPESQSILIGLINYYLSNNENPDRLFELIALAKQNEPNNASLYYVEGNIYLELRKADMANSDMYVAKAVEAYDACATINPEYEFGYIGKGIMYYNIALEYQDKASDPALSYQEWEAVNQLFAESLKSALEPFETAYNLSKDNSLKVNIAESLKQIYYRFYADGPEWEEGYRKYAKVVETGTAL